jgi:hypothetical protein
VEQPVTTLVHRRFEARLLSELVSGAPDLAASLTDDHRRSLSARFRAIAIPGHRRLDAWTVEQAGRISNDFHWSPATARRVIGNGALRRTTADPALSVLDAVRDEIADQLLRATAGRARFGSLSHWLASSPNPVIGLVTCEALNWATQLNEVAEALPTQWSVAASDAYYDVASARTTLRGRRDLVIPTEHSRVIVRVRSGAPGKSAGPGLRADLTIDALTDPEGAAPVRIIGLWPEAGVCLAVDGSMDDLRAGARDLVRTAVAQRRHAPTLAA